MNITQIQRGNDPVKHDKKAAVQARVKTLMGEIEKLNEQEAILGQRNSV
jgi:hypothetical protein